MQQLLLFLLFSFSLAANAQSFNENKTAFANFIKRMYTATPFEGVKIIDDYDHQYLVSVVSLEPAKYTNQSIMNRVAQVKAQSQANTFINGASITMDFVIKTSEKTHNDTTTTIIETLESIKQNSLGFTKGLELLNNFNNQDLSRMVYVYYRELNKP
jgi:6-pyruvoyl-tetrahydropterin synthase